MRKISILVSGRELPAADAVLRIFEGQPDLEITTADSGNLEAIVGTHDVLVTLRGPRWEEVLRALAARPAAGRPALIVVGPAGDPASMRRAMQAGARDFFSMPVAPAELLGAVRLIGHEVGSGVPVTKGTLTAVINAKGGSGASFLAANLAHITAVQKKSPVALIDLDLQFGALPLAFDLQQRNSLIEALGNAHQLDPVALQGYMARHESGVHVLGTMSDQLPLPWEIPADSLRQVLGLAMQAYSNVVVDLPRQIDPLTSLVLSQANCIALVTQQSFTHTRDTKRLLRIITSSLAVPRDRVVVVLNRYNEKDQVRIQDIEEAVNPPALVPVPNDFRSVSESLNTGVPLLQSARQAPITRTLQALAGRLCGIEAPEAAAPPRRGFFGGERA